MKRLLRGDAHVSDSAAKLETDIDHNEYRLSWINGYIFRLAQNDQTKAAHSLAKEKETNFGALTV